MLLGVQLDAPGWERISVKPHALGLKELSRVVPTPKGEVRVGWHVEDNGQMHLCVQSPMCRSSSRSTGRPTTRNTARWSSEEEKKNEAVHIDAGLPGLGFYAGGA